MIYQFIEKMESNLSLIKKHFLQLKDGPNDKQFADIVNKILELAQIDEKINEDSDNNEKKDKTGFLEKIKPYAGCFTSEKTQNTIYVLSRTIGGLCSTGVEYRQGYLALLKQFILKHDKEINYPSLLEQINKESYFKKTEVQGVKNAFSCGKIVTLSEILSTSREISTDCISKSTDYILSSCATSTNSEELAIYSFKSFLSSVNPNTKKLQKIVEEVISKWLSKDSDLLFHYAVLLILSISGLSSKTKTENSSISSFIQNFLKTKPKYALDNHLFCLDGSTPETLQKLISALVLGRRDHVFLTLYLEFLAINCKNSSTNAFKYIGVTWNTITETSYAAELIEKSNKNYQYVLTKLSICIIENVDIEKVFLIFDYNFFKTFLKFEGGKSKTACINQIINSLIARLNSEAEVLNSSSKQNTYNSYCTSLLELFTKGLLSSINYKSFFLLLFHNISETQRGNLITNIIESKTEHTNGVNMDIDDQEVDEKDSRQEFYTKVNLLKNIMTVSYLFIYIV